MVNLENREAEVGSLTLERAIKEGIKDLKLESLAGLPVLDLPGRLELMPPRPSFLNIL